MIIHFNLRPNGKYDCADLRNRSLRLKVRLYRIFFLLIRVLVRFKFINALSSSIIDQCNCITFDVVILISLHVKSLMKLLI